MAEQAACGQWTRPGSPVKGGKLLASGHAPLDWQVARDREQDLRTTYRMQGPAVASKLVLLEEKEEGGEGEGGVGSIRPTAEAVQGDAKALQFTRSHGHCPGGPKLLVLIPALPPTSYMALEKPLGPRVRTDGSDSLSLELEAGQGRQALPGFSPPACTWFPWLRTQPGVLRE